MGDGSNVREIHIVEAWGLPVFSVSSGCERGTLVFVVVVLGGCTGAEERVDVCEGQVGAGEAELLKVFSERKELCNVMGLNLCAVKIEGAERGG